jgi:hypothetical protein
VTAITRTDRESTTMRIRGLLALAVVSAIILHASTTLAVPASLLVDGVQGEGPGGTIGVTSFQFLPPDGAEIQIVKAIDSTSAKLLQFTVQGTQTPTVTMVVTWPGKRGTVTYTMSDVLFTSLVVNGTNESATFRWTTIAQSQSIATVRVGGKVIDLCTGKPIVGASVTLTSPPSSSASGASDPHGRFKVAGLVNGAYRLAVAASGYLEFVSTTLVAGTKDPGAMTIGLTPLVPAGGCS